MPSISNHPNKRFSIKGPPPSQAILLAGMAVFLSITGSLPSSPSFVGIDGTTIIRALSADGSVAGAEHHPSAFLWDAHNGLADIGHLAIPGYGPNQVTEVAGISADGSVMVGSSSSYSGFWSKTQAYRWTQKEGFTSLVDAAVWESHAVGVSEDGRTVAGWIIVESGQHAVLWRDGLETLRLEAGTSFGGISRNGLWATGTKADGNNVQPFRWSVNAGLTLLGSGTSGSYGRAISNDGNVVVGQGDTGQVNGTVPFRWAAGAGMQFLGILTDGDQGYATALSADGKTVVGSFSDAGAFVWTEAQGLRHLKDALQTDHGMNLNAWNLRGAWTISGDGRSMAGHGLLLTMGGSIEKGYIARLGEVSTPGISITTEGDAIRMEFQGVLQSSPDLKHWTDTVPQPSSPYFHTPTSGNLFFRARSP
jgi:uncharacterized membrane protein